MPDIPEEAVQAAAPVLVDGLESWRERAETAEAAIARVRALHKPFQRRDRVPYCDHCSVSAGTPWRRYVLVPWPCDTLAALGDTEGAAAPSDREST